MTPQNKTRVVVWGTVGWLIAYDVYTAIRYGKGSTISVVMGDDSHAYPIIAGLFFGVLAHIFWSRK